MDGRGLSNDAGIAGVTVGAEDVGTGSWLDVEDLDVVTAGLFEMSCVPSIMS